MDDFSQTKKQIHWCIALAAFLFLFSIWLGYELAILNPESSKNFINYSLSQFDFVRDFNSFFVFLFILFNNLIKGFLAMVSGTLFGIMPAIFIFTNGELVGLVLGIFSSNRELKQAAAGLVPHGIFEIPAVIISTGHGFWLGYRFYRHILFKEPFKESFFYALGYFAKVALPLFVIAAFVETFITPAIVKIFS